MNKVKVIKETETTIHIMVDGKICMLVKESGKALEDYVIEIRKDRKDTERIMKITEKKYSSMSEEERKRKDEADRVLFERWQDEANTNLYLSEEKHDENYDYDFNPFRKDE